jgi:hypothetical protein
MGAQTLVGQVCSRWKLVISNGPEQVEVTDPKRRGKFVNRDNGWVATAFFEPADVLLAKSGELSELFLGQPLPLPDSPNIPPHQLAHVHARRSADHIL